jgi:hypothetical protein
LITQLVQATGIQLPQSLLQTILASQPSGLQSQSQLGSQAQLFTSPVHQVPQSFVSLGFTPIQTGFTPLTQSQMLMPDSSQFHATYSQIIGQPTLTYTPAATLVLDVSAAQPQSDPAPEGLTGTSTTESIPSSVASTDPPLVPVTQTAPLVIHTQTATASESQGRHTGSLPPPQSATETTEQTQTVSPALLVSEAPTSSLVQPQPSPESSLDDAPNQFIVAHRTPMAGSSASPSFYP